MLSQQIIFCKGVTENGAPIEQISNRKAYIGETIFILLKNNSLFEQNIIFLHIDRREKQSAKNIFSTLIRPDKKNNWTGFNYLFNTDGTYEIYFKDFTQKKIASALLLVTEPEKKPQHSLQKVETQPNIKVVFCRSVYNNKPQQFYKTISLSNQNGEAYIYMFNNSPLNTDILYVRFWRKRSFSSVYDEFLDSKKYETNPAWYETFFKYRFTNAGDYKIDFFNEKDLLLKTAYISVEE